MFNVMVEGVLEAKIPYWALRAYPAGHLHPKTVAGEEHRRGKVPAFASRHPGAVHVDLPDNRNGNPQTRQRVRSLSWSQAPLPLSISHPADAVLTPGRLDGSPDQCLHVSRQTLRSPAPTERNASKSRSLGVAASPATPGSGQAVAGCPTAHWKRDLKSRNGFQPWTGC
jgi:hypothetical protein